MSTFCCELRNQEFHKPDSSIMFHQCLCCVLNCYIRVESFSKHTIVKLKIFKRLKYLYKEQCVPCIVIKST